MNEIVLRAYDNGRKEYLSGGCVLIVINPGERPQQSDIYLDNLTRRNAYKDRFIIEIYTGLKDKNDKPIFEGDIIKTQDIIYGGEIQILGETGTVTLCSGCFCFINNDRTNFLYLETGVEIISNIHDNPELLEENNA